MYRREKMWQRQKNGLKDFLAENTMMNAAIEQMDGVVSWTAFQAMQALRQSSFFWI